MFFGEHLGGTPKQPYIDAGIGSYSAETYQAIIGTAGFSVNNGSGYNSSTNTASHAYHDLAAGGQSGATFSSCPPRKMPLGTR